MHPILFCKLNCRAKAACAIFLALFILALITPDVSASNNTPDNQTGQDSLPQWILPTKFTYSSLGKPDPFKPFLQTKETIAEQDPEDETQKFLTPLERVQPSQLTLVGIIWETELQNQSLAMVELPDGKGYILRQGSKIGNQQGQVIRITPQRVFIQEQISMPDGQEELQNTVLELHKSAGEPNE